MTKNPKCKPKVIGRSGNLFPCKFTVPCGPGNMRFSQVWLCKPADESGVCSVSVRVGR